MRSYHLLAALALSMAVAFPQVNAEEKVRLTNGEWAPYQSEQLPHYGAASHMISLAYESVGINVEYGFFPWNRAMALVELGAWDGTFMWVLTPERQRKFLVSDPLFSIREVLFFSRNNALTARKQEELKGLVMGALESSAFGEQFSSMIKSGDIVVARVNNNKQLFQMLASGRIDFVPELETSGYEAVREHLSVEQQKRITHLEAMTHPWSYHLLISRFIDNGPYLIDTFNRGMAIIKADGSFEKVMGPYIRSPAIK